MTPRLSADEVQRLNQLCNDGETIHAAIKVDDTDDGAYYLVVREWDHPDIDDKTILSERYAYLTTTEDGSDGWVDNGINRRNDADGQLAAQLAELYDEIAAVQRDDTNKDGAGVSDDLTETEG